MPTVNQIPPTCDLFDDDATDVYEALAADRARLRGWELVADLGQVAVDLAELAESPAIDHCRRRRLVRLALRNRDLVMQLLEELVVDADGEGGLS